MPTLDLHTEPLGGSGGRIQTALVGQRAPPSCYRPRLQVKIHRPPEHHGWPGNGAKADAAQNFIFDVAGRLANRVQLTTDGHGVYLSSVLGAFGVDVDFAQLIKIYGLTVDTAGPERKSSPGECCGTRKRRVLGKARRPAFYVSQAMNRAGMTYCSSSRSYRQKQLNRKRRGIARQNVSLLTATPRRLNSPP